MSENTNTPAPPWGTNGGPPPAVFRAPPKRQRTSTHTANPTAKFVPPKDLAKHLARTQPVNLASIALPRSTTLHCLRVNYGILFPYADKPIIELALKVFTPAGFIDFRPFKGYFDLGFDSDATANEAAKIPLIFKGTPIHTTRTRLPTDITAVVNFSNLPSHLPPQLLYNELVEGISRYGKFIELKFMVPTGANHLAAPRASATFNLFNGLNPKQIPPRASIPSAPLHPFTALVEGGLQTCRICHSVAHSSGNCPSKNSHQVSGNNIQLSPPIPTWGAILEPPSINSDHKNNADKEKQSTYAPGNNFNSGSTPENNSMGIGNNSGSSGFIGADLSTSNHENQVQSENGNQVDSNYMGDDSEEIFDHGNEQMDSQSHLTNLGTISAHISDHMTPNSSNTTHRTISNDNMTISDMGTQNDHPNNSNNSNISNNSNNSNNQNQAQKPLKTKPWNIPKDDSTPINWQTRPFPEQIISWFSVNPYDLLDEVDENNTTINNNQTFDPTIFFTKSFDVTHSKKYKLKDPDDGFGSVNVAVAELQEHSKDHWIHGNLMAASRALLTKIPPPVTNSIPNQTIAEDIQKLHNGAVDTIQIMATNTVKVLVGKNTKANLQLHSELFDHRIYAEECLAELYEAEYKNGILNPQNSILASLYPHPADAPTPILSALEQYMVIRHGGANPEPPDASDDAMSG